MTSNNGMQSGGAGYQTQHANIFSQGQMQQAAQGAPAVMQQMPHAAGAGFEQAFHSPVPQAAYGLGGAAQVMHWSSYKLYYKGQALSEKLVVQL